MSNVMRTPFVSRLVLSAGATGNELPKAAKLLTLITKKKAQIVKAGPRTRIPAFNVRPGLELGTRVTLRGKEALDILRQMLGGIENTLKKKQVQENHFSFGIEEYIDIPGLEYQRDLGIRGFNVTVVFERKGKRVQNKKLKRGKIPRKQHVTQQEIIDFMKANYKTRFI